MEASLAFGLLKIAGDKFVSLLASEFAAISGVKKYLSELQDIHREVTSWVSVVCHQSMENHRSFGWVIKLKDVAYDIDDLLYAVHLEAEKHKLDSIGGKYAIAGCFCGKPKSFVFRCQVAKKIRAIKVTVEEIAKQRNDMNAIWCNLPLNQTNLSTNRATGYLTVLTNVEESQIPTRDQEKGNIVGKLLESNEGKDGWIVSVVGLGGSGKTTLAKHICHDSKIKEHFKDKIYWVHVSQEFDVKKLIGKLFEAVTKNKSDIHALQHMVIEISKSLSGKKFLLVLDDAWHEDKDGWKDFMVPLMNRPPGSKLLLTSRDQNVAKAVKSGYIFDLAFLSEAESWSLFLKSSAWAEEDLGSEYTLIGKEITRKCGGVPLAIRTLGGILSEKRDINIWRAIRQSDLWNEKNTEGRVFASLKLSYIHLNDDVKKCFTFCSIFPKGCRINKDYLIEQWIAHGFIINQRMDLQPEVIGREYFDSLEKVGFFQDPQKVVLGYVAYKMHDLIHDLSRYILQNEVVTSLPNNIPKDFIQKCRYLSLTSCSETVERVCFEKVRALYVEGNPSSLEKLVKKSHYIFSVFLYCAKRTPFPLFILKLDYIGYLEIHNLSCKEFPEDISDCWNLQSLHLICCSGFATLPVSIGKLKKLRTLELILTDIESLPQSIGHCDHLYSLQIRNCRKFREIPGTIGKNQNLSVLQIVNCEDFHQLPSEFIGKFSTIANTESFRYLKTLNLSKTRVTKLPEWVTLIGALECINLKCCYELVELPTGIGKLKMLEFLNLKQCWQLSWMPSGFARLTRLRRLDLYVVGSGGDDAKISDLNNLNMISGSLEIKNLQHLVDPRDAEKACFKQKKNIQNLTLSWSSSSVMEEESPSDLGVLDALEPPAAIEKLHIYNYRGSHLPYWICTKSGSSYLEGKVLKETCQPRFLRLIELVMCEMPNLQYMRGVLVLPSLKTLRLIGMPNLEELWSTTSGLGIGEEEEFDMHCFPALSHLEIRDCPKLIVEPYFPPSLESLKLHSTYGQQVPPGRSFVRLLPPHADEPSSSSGAFAAVPRLKKLSVFGMNGSASDWGFLQYLARLKSLDVLSCTELTELPESMRGLTSLIILRILEFSTLAVLPEWLGELRSLKYLRISECPALQSLPGSMERLTALQCLHISGCPALSRRYKKEGVDDWRLIANIPSVDIDHRAYLHEAPALQHPDLGTLYRLLISS